MSVQIVNSQQVCPECQQAHQSAKDAQICLIAAINRWLIEVTHSENHAKAHLQYFLTLLYYKQCLISDNPIQANLQFQVLGSGVHQAHTTSADDGC
jgi:hypothetical protein